MKTALIGVALLLEVILLPSSILADDECPRMMDCAEIRNSTTADIRLVDNTVIGTYSSLGDFFIDIHDGIPRCGVWQPGYVIEPYFYLPNNTCSGIYDGDGYTCTPLCGNRSTITSRYRVDLSSLGIYRFGWELETCSDNKIIYEETFTNQPWDAPTCEPCVNDNSTVCGHAFRRSLVISSRPDLTLSSPLGERTVERTYRTALIGDAAAGDGMFGKGWRANFEFRIETFKYNYYGNLLDNPYGVMLFDAAGRKIFYKRNSFSPAGVFASPDGKGGLITRAADGMYLWQDAKGTSYQFDSNGNILSISDVHGNQERFGYTGGKIASLTDRHDRVVTFEYYQETSHVKRLLGPATAANLTGEYASYTYDANGNLTGVSYPDGNALIYEYENPSWPNYMTGYAVDGPDGPELQQSFQYNGQGRLQAISEGPHGRSYQLEYTTEQVEFDPLYPDLGDKTIHSTNVREWTDVNWNFVIDPNDPEHPNDPVNIEASSVKPLRTYHYENQDGADVVTKIENGDCSACAAEKVYDSAYHIIESRDSKGIATMRFFNSNGDITMLTEAAGTVDEKSTGYEYDYAGTPVFPGQILKKITRQVSVVSPSEDKITTEFNDEATGRLHIRREQGYTLDGVLQTYDTVYSYTTSGALDTVDGPRPGTIDRITYDYYATGMLKTITEPNDAVTTFQEYDGLGNVLRKTDSNDRDTIFAYDGRGHLQSMTTVDGTTSYEYDTLGNVAKITYPKGNSVSYEHGQSGLTSVLDDTGSIVYGYTNGNKISESIYSVSEPPPTSNPKKKTDYRYDNNNRLKETIQANGDYEEFLYDDNGNLTVKHLYDAAPDPDVLLKTTVQVYDSLNRLQEVFVNEPPDESPYLRYGYDSQGNLETVTDPINQTTSYLYDDFGRQGRVVSPETGTTDFTHNEAGNVTIRKDNLNRLSSYTYDGLNRLTGITYSDSTVPVLYRYDDYSAGTFTDAVGKLTEVSDASGFRRFFYNAAGHLSKVEHTIDLRTPPFTLEYGYDANGNLVSITYPDKRIIQYDYEPLSDRVQSVTSWKNGVATVLAENINYKPFGPMSGFDYGNGTYLSRDYENQMYRLDSLAVTGPMGEVIPARNYGYYPTGNIESITRDLPSGAETHEFGYDPMDRLLTWNKPGYFQNFTYDANGNRQTLSDNGLESLFHYEGDSLNFLTRSSTGAQSLVYAPDPIGNVTGWGTKSLTYDINSRLGLVEDGSVTVSEYICNLDGQRAKKTAAGQTVYYEYDQNGHLIYEYRVTGGVSVDYVYLGGEPLAMLVSDDYTVTPAPGPNGTLTPSEPQTVDRDETIAFTVSPDTCYRVDGVTGCGGDLSSNIYTTAPITADCTVEANFTRITYAVTPIVEGNGSLTPSTPQAVNCGQTTAFIVSPDTGNHLNSVTGCEGTLVGDTYTTAQTTADCTVAADFGINTYGLTITKSGTGTGTVTSSPAGLNCGTTCVATYDYGTIVNLTATANAGKVFTSWSGDCSGLGACAVTMTAARTVDANFTKGLTVNVPNDLTAWGKDTDQTIQWSYLGSPGPFVKIELFKAGVLDETITASTSIGSNGSGSFLWHIPGSKATANNYRIKVTSTAGSYTDQSNGNFTIN